MTEWRGKRILISGAAGFIGANLSRDLAGRGADVTGLVRPGSRAWRLEDGPPEIRIVPVDVSDPDAVFDAVRSARPEVIFHAAAEGGHSASSGERRRSLKTGVLGTQAMLEAAEAAGIERFIHLGSSLELGPGDPKKLETDRLCPSTFRGAVKAAEALLCLEAAGNRGIPVTLLRLFAVYGYWEQPFRLVPTVMMAALTGDPIRLVDPGSRRDFVFVEDVVSACRRSAECDAAPGEIFHIGGGRERDVREIVDRVRSVTGRPVRVLPEAFPVRTVDAPHWEADILKAERVLGWRPEIPLDEGLSRTYAWFEKNRGYYEPRP